MKLNIINNNHGDDSKAWYSLKPLHQYLDQQGIPTMWGLGSANYTKAVSYVKNNKPWLFCDMPYWGRWNPLKMAVNPHGEYYWRTCFKGIHVNKIVDGLPYDRIKNITLKDWRTKGEYILIAPSSPTVNRFIGEPNWEQETIKFLKTVTDMHIRVRHKPRRAGKSGPAYALTPLMEDLKNASCVITSCSMVAVDAIIEGIPVYCNANGSTYPVAQDIKKYGDPVYSDRRKDWLATLSYHQYTSEEIQDGLFKKMFEEMYNEMR